MYCFADFLVVWCLFLAGYFFGYYCNYAYVYDNLFPHWYGLLGASASLVLSVVWTVHKYRRRQYSFNHFYIIFYGLICFLISSCFMISSNLEISFYFGFIGLCSVFVASYSLVNLRCSSKGLRPMHISLGNMLFFAGLSTGFSLFNEFEAEFSGWIYLGITISMLLGTVISEVLQFTNVRCYKKSCDLVFNLMNDEKMIFKSKKSIYAIFANRPEFYFTKNRQWLVVGLSSVVVLEQIFLFSPTALQLAWNSTYSYLSIQYLSGPFLLFTIGCAMGTVLMVRYKPKLLYFFFGLIKITVSCAILGVYSDDRVEDCFYFLCLYYVSFGVYSSVALQMVLECTPFLYTEIGMALALVIKLFFLEILKYETYGSETFYLILGLGLSSVLITIVCLVVVPVFVPPSEGLIDIRNRLLGIRRHYSSNPQTTNSNANYFLHHDSQPNDLDKVIFDGNRVFQQYPRPTRNNLE